MSEVLARVDRPSPERRALLQKIVRKQGGEPILPESGEMSDEEAGSALAEVGGDPAPARVR